MPVFSLPAGILQRSFSWDDPEASEDGRTHTMHMCTTCTGTAHIYIQRLWRPALMAAHVEEALPTPEADSTGPSRAAAQRLDVQLS